MKITFIRHGEAENRGFITMAEDERRPLTPRGKKMVRKRFEALRQKLGRGKKEIWTSHFLRAKETAEILSEVLAVPISLTDYLTVTNFTYFKREAKNVGDKDLFVVSHEPFVGEFVEAMTGTRPHVSVGDYFTVQVEDLETLRGKLLEELSWYGRD